MMRLRPALLLLLALPALLAGQPVRARESLGVFERWGAFRDPAVPRCYAIAEPARKPRGEQPWRAFASVGTWPRQGLRGQVHFRLSRARADGSRLLLGIGDARFPLVGGAADAWAADRRGDAAIVAAIRSGTSMSVEGVGRDGRAFADVYALRGAATAIDAAALGCARIR
ncbi:MAG: hypothetical protein DI547_02385 [Sphingobium sp.]|nr:MAG: hypothetical protein DI547_02385 [Sphingobium sp.]